MEQVIRNTIKAVLNTSEHKKVKIKTILNSIKRSIEGKYSIFELENRLPDILMSLQDEQVLLLPSQKGKRKSWDRNTGLPNFVWVVKTENLDAKNTLKEEWDSLRNKTAWEPTIMVEICEDFRNQDLEDAIFVNDYLKERKPDIKKIPHRERSLQIFGDEKYLDKKNRKPFGGLITLAQLDCFYCPSPLPFQPLPKRRSKIKEKPKPLLIVENSNTYWSCCKANELGRLFAAVVYGQGFKAMSKEKACESIPAIEHELHAEGIWYFGDLDPAGLEIPYKIDQYRKAEGMEAIQPALPLYKALMTKGLITGYERKQKGPEPEWIQEWLGPDIADIYLELSKNCRWPQEGLTATDMLLALTNDSWIFP
ncbi:DUF2220 family protein [Desulfobacterales bacterium HSG16]|nr:DUF2220 family protein [Desulfobacterales bacterium HSG16]